MTSTAGPRPTVLVVDDEEAVADVLAMKIDDEYDVRVAYGGRDALDAFGESVDAVVLDRRMSDVHGDEVLEEIRRRDSDCAVVVTTAVDPDLNILELDFDDYLTKPIRTEDLLAALDQQLDRAAADPQLEAFFAALSKIDLLEARYPPEELATNEEYAALVDRVEALRGELTDSHADFEDLVATFRDIDREP